MDNNEFLDNFMNIDILQVEGVAEIIGRVIAKLRAGMIEGGIHPAEADNLINLAFSTFLNLMKNWE